MDTASAWVLVRAIGLLDKSVSSSGRCIVVGSDLEMYLAAVYQLVELVSYWYVYVWSKSLG